MTRTHLKISFRYEDVRFWTPSRAHTGTTGGVPKGTSRIVTTEDEEGVQKRAPQSKEILR